MNDLDIIDAEVVVTASEVRESIDRAKAGALTFWREVQWQVENEAWTTLGYESLDQFWDAEYMALNVGIARSDRPELVLSFRKAGQTQTQIAEKLNVGQATVNRDLANIQMDNRSTPSRITNARGDERPATYAKPAPANVNTDTGEINPGPTVGEMNTAAREQRQSDRADSARFDLALSTIAGLANPQFADALRRAHSNIGTDPGIVGTRHNAETLHHLAQILDDYATTLENQP